MSLLQRLLLLPLLSPLLAVLLLGAVNPRPWVALRLLTWTTAAIPLGAWIGGAAAAGAALSAAATGLALQSGAATVASRRQVRRHRDGEPDAEPWPESASQQGAPAPANRSPWRGWAGPTRAAADPPPTVSVPFRVIRKGSSPAASATSATTSASTTVGGGDGWDSPISDEW